MTVILFFEGSDGREKRTNEFLFVFPYHILDKTGKNLKSVKNEQKIGKTNKKE
jgi:hypothetical protein